MHLLHGKRQDWSRKRYLSIDLFRFSHRNQGNSKQAAKTEAAKAAICTLVTKEIYANEGHAILLSIQKGK